MSLNDSIIVLNPGRGGDETDATEFLLYDAYGAPILFTSGTQAGTQESVKRERIVISGDDARENIVNPVLLNGAYRLPTYDEPLRRALDAQSLQLQELIEKEAPTGQMPMTASLPVTMASDQKPIPVQSLYGNRPTYSASTNGTVATGTAIAAVASIAYLFHPANLRTRIEIGKIFVGFTGGAGNSDVSMLGAFITAENAAPGGTVQTINAHEPSDPPSALTFRSGATGAPTRVTGDLIAAVGHAQISIQGMNFMMFEPMLNGKPIILSPGNPRGFEIRSVVGISALTTAAQISVSMTWTELDKV